VKKKEMTHIKGKKEERERGHKIQRVRIVTNIEELFLELVFCLYL